MIGDTHKKLRVVYLRNFHRTGESPVCFFVCLFCLFLNLQNILWLQKQFIFWKVCFLYLTTLKTVFRKDAI